MPWAWVAVGLVLWTFTALVVIALCLSVRQIDARLGRDGEWVATDPEPHAGAGDEGA